MGYRLLAVSLLPISSETLVYGSADGGRTMRAENQLLNQALQDIARISFIKPHLAGSDPMTRRMIFSCADLEGHRTEPELGDGRFYLADFSRVLPPETPSSQLKNAHLYRLFRTEFLRVYAKPLNPDAYSCFSDNKVFFFLRGEETRKKKESLTAIF